MIVVGLDLSLTSTGIATVESSGDSLTWTLDRLGSLPPGRDAPWWDHRCRLVNLANAITESAGSRGRPELVVIEGRSDGNRTGKAHDRAGLWWIVAAELSRHSDVAVVSPSGRMVYATGSGRADKDRVLAAAVRRYPDVPIDGNDAADAVILAAMGARWLGEPVDDTLPQTHLRALDKVQWPANRRTKR